MHTPGPWHTGFKPGPIIYGPKGDQVADLMGDLLPRSETLANARLIARAPELRAALAWALDQIEDSLDLDHQAALAGARKLLKD